MHRPYRHFLVMAMIAVLLPGCLPRSFEHQAPLPESQASPSQQSGSATITGKVSVHTRDGLERPGSESTVYLIPATAYSAEWFEHSIVNGKKINGKDPRSFGSTRAAATEADGRFEFRAVAPGEYFLTGTVQYQRPGFRMGRLNFGLRTLEKVEAYARVKVEANQHVDVAVTHPPA